MDGTVYKTPRYTIGLVRQPPALSEYRIISASHTAAEVLRVVIGDTDREHFIVLCLDGKNRVIGANVAHIGSLTLAIVHPREVFKAAILLNSASIILGHNHPSGDTDPSPEDRELTKRLKDAGEILGIKVLDHVIVGEGKYFSFADQGHL